MESVQKASSGLVLVVDDNPEIRCRSKRYLGKRDIRSLVLPMVRRRSTI
jgi:hypothetical protein